MLLHTNYTLLQVEKHMYMKILFKNPICNLK